MNASRSFMAAAALSNGGVLVAGGLNGGTVLQSAEVYSPATSTARKDMPRGRKELLAKSSRSPRLAALTLADAFAGIIW
jgi:hypothetical protein